MENSDELKRFLREVPQIVSEEYCQRCRICCRFPESQNVQTPFWSEGEAQLAQEAGGSADWFITLHHTVSRGIRLERCGEGYRCPAFDPEANRCTLHAVKPLDCRLYPFVLAASPGKSEVVLTMDMKCPYLQEKQDDPAVAAYAHRLEGYLSSPLALAFLRSNPKIVGSYWPEYVAVAGLPGAAPILRGEPLPAPHPDLRPLAPADWTLLEPSFRLRPHAFSGYSRAALFGWQDVVRLYWTDLDGTPAIFSEQGGGWFMPLPPLSQKVRPGVVRKAWELLRELNRGGGVSRVEGIEAGEAGAWKEMGFRLRLSESEYLYRREPLAALRGNAYRSQRWAINRFRREDPLPCRVRPFEENDGRTCLQLYTHWAIEKQKRCAQKEAVSLVRDGLFFHRRILMHQREWGLTGQVVEIGDRIAAYTLGAALSRKVFCVFVEIADPVLPGLGAFLFREFCRQLKDYPFLNAMGDEGLDGLRQAKQSYRPMGFARSYAAEFPET